MNHQPHAPTPAPEDADRERRRREEQLLQKSSADTPPGEWSALGSTRVIDHTPRDADNPRPQRAAGEPAPGGDANQKGVNTLGDYRLLKKLGEGAMGMVYRARQLSTSRDVAVKVLFKHIANNPKLVERFYREARVSGRLDHPNLVQGFEVGEDHGWHYFAMEFVDGESLQKWLGRAGRLSVGDALHVTLRCAAALQHAHEHGIIHRDIKPDNVLITRQGGVKVADLGMVKMLDEDMSLTQTGHAVGTPWYMPLEQARNSKDADGRCDIYALGCVLYCMLTGQPPFSGRTLVDVIQAKEAGTFPPARQANPAVPERLDLLLCKMTAKQVKYRHASCAEVIRDLEALGLASPTLDFDGPRSGVHKGAVPVAPTPAPTPQPTPLPAADVWYLRQRPEGGAPTVRKMSTAQLVVWIDGPEFDPTAQVSRSRSEGYRAPATFKELQSIVLGRTSKVGADRQASKLRKLIQKAGEQKLQRDREEKEAADTTTAGYWLSIFWRVLPVAIAIGALVLIGALLINALR